ncbi:ImmA/IrrE family metallo-endopeptidase [Clostridium perfringens]|nr:ImmA/IrrE family metallo-endopeptidase [Clostridium perfringens]MDK0978073.1 ImmA/IrrE family metallo-endopeptidase [Clostridium perfringens]
MTKYEELIEEIRTYNVEVVELMLGGDYGYCYNDVIFINETSSEKTKYCILAEEIGHYFTSYGNIINLSDTKNIHQENKARIWAYEKLISPDALVEALNNGLNTTEEIIEYFNITKEFFLEAIKYYRKRYGIYYVGKKCVLNLEPLYIINF